jgi:Cu(I)/Ag(I) efflux system membrane protein CusA/SilA
MGITGMGSAVKISGLTKPLLVRYSRDFWDDVEQLKHVVIATPTGAQIPISEVAKVYFSRGPAMEYATTIGRDRSSEWTTRQRMITDRS